MRMLLREFLRLACCLAISCLGIWLYIGWGFIRGKGPYQDWPNFFGAGQGILAAIFFMTSDWSLIWGPALFLYSLGLLKRVWSRSRAGKRDF
ncbi:hypothetical protein X474_06655 [Dethiosulfatarculus sandiegensis]|uniref:Uncharacterized protein n=1 Tax=Dethiosulfatarculus sandiegensis TaxID=1429043 RepID=A0A0D2JZ39_9BACT|nr:hypothetical protein X474_06655 [Dethiosulfatarculus sandiegensis]